MPLADQLEIEALMSRSLASRIRLLWAAQALRDAAERVRRVSTAPKSDVHLVIGSEGGEDARAQWIHSAWDDLSLAVQCKEGLQTIAARAGASIGKPELAGLGAADRRVVLQALVAHDKDAQVGRQGVTWRVQTIGIGTQ